VDELCRRYDGIPREVFSNTELMELMLPGLRADVEMFETYEYGADTPLACPISAFGGSLDRSVSLRELDAWRHQTAGTFTLRTVPGNHFFLNSARETLLSAISEDLQRYSLVTAQRSA
jgi:medium-chain acyl-[acyl-carrier-protein] hydrolase